MALAKGRYDVSATSAPPSIQYGIDVQCSSGISVITVCSALDILAVIEQGTLALRQASVTLWL